MSRGPWKWKPSDMTRAVKAVLKAGVDVATVMVDQQGRIAVIIGKPGNTVDAGNAAWDKAIAELESRR